MVHKVAQHTVAVEFGGGDVVEMGLDASGETVVDDGFKMIGQEISDQLAGRCWYQLTRSEPVFSVMMVRVMGPTGASAPPLDGCPRAMMFVTSHHWELRVHLFDPAPSG